MSEEEERPRGAAERCDSGCASQRRAVLTAGAACGAPSVFVQ